MKHWPTKLLGELCDVRIGRTPRRDQPRFWGGNAVWVTIGELNGGEISSSKENISDIAVRECMPEPVPTGTLLFSFKLSIGKMAIAGCPLYTNEAIAALPILNPRELSRDYLRYALMAESREGTADTAVLGKILNKEKVKQLSIPVPPLAEQERIVEVLDEVNELGELRTQADSRSRALIPALFHVMFGDIASDKGRWPWTDVATVSKQVVVGHVGPTTHGYRETGVPFLRTQNVRPMFVDPADVKHISAEFNSTLRKSKLKAGDVVISRVGVNRGMSAVIPPELDDANCAKIIVVRPDDALDPYYLAFLLNSSFGQSGLLGVSVGSAQGVINTTSVKQFRIPVPPLLLQKEFARRVAEIGGMEADQAASRRGLDALFQSTLHRAFNGDL